MKKIFLLISVLLVVFGISGCKHGDNNGGGYKAPEGFVYLKAGSFIMGMNGDAAATIDKPAHKVTLTKGFIMCDHEVTKKEYYEVIKPSYTDTDNKPQTMSWYTALDYCNKRSEKEGLTPCYSIVVNGVDETDTSKWDSIPDAKDSIWENVKCEWNANGYRIPTEAEWEYAARAGNNATDGTLYSGTTDVNELEKFAWYGKSSVNNRSGLIEVKSLEPNEYGLYDMSGNAWEMVWDIYKKYSEEDATDPHVDTSRNSSIVIRGGGYAHGEDCCDVRKRVSWHSYENYEVTTPKNANYALGLRVVRTVD